MPFDQKGPIKPEIDGPFSRVVWPAYARFEYCRLRPIPPLRAAAAAALPRHFATGRNEISIAAIAMTPALAYRDLAVLILAVLGVAIFDAFEAARLSLGDGIKLLFVTIFLILLVLDFAACAISYGLEAGTAHELAPRLPGWFFWQAILLSLFAKISAVVSEKEAI